MVVPVDYGEGVGEIPLDAWYADGSSWGKPPTETEVAIQTNTDTIWMEIRTNHSNQGAELRALGVNPLH